jgi:hypothetical protein
VEHQEESTLDPDCANLLRRAKAAVEAILASDACTHDLIQPPVDKKLLRDNVQAISAAGHGITDLRAEHTSIIAKSSPKPVEGPCQTCGGTGHRRTWHAPDRPGRPGPPRHRPVAQEPFHDSPCSHCSGSGRASYVQPGPTTADAIKSQQKALATVLESATSRVESLERYALSVKAVDAKYRDWIGVQQATYRDLIGAQQAESLARRCLRPSRLAVLRA